MKRALPHLCVALLVGAIALSGGLEFLDNRLTDLRFRLTPRPASGEVVVVAIDPASLQTLDVWPWPRGYHASVLENLFAAGARRIAFDVDFSSRSVEEEDQAFEEALAASDGRVVLPVFRQWHTTAGFAGGLTTTQPMKSFAQHAKLATINVRPGRDGLARRYWMNDVVPRTGIRSMAATLVKRTPDIESFYVDFGIEHDTIPVVSYQDVLTGQFDARHLQGRAVIIGATAIELGDQVAVPLLSIMPGPILQALACESLVQGRALRRVPPAVVFLLTLVVGTLIGTGVESRTWRSGLFMTLILIPGLFAVSAWVQSSYPVLLDVAPMCLSVTGSYIFGLIRRVDQQGLRLLFESSRAQRTEMMMQRVVDTSFDAIIVVNPEGEIERFNTSAERMFECETVEAIGQPVTRFLQGTLAWEVRIAPRDPRRTARGPMEGEGFRKNGETFPVEMTLTNIKQEDRALCVAFLRDITMRKAQEEALQHQATHDALTGLPNRFLLRERVEEVLGDARRSDGRAAFLILDLDRFKEVNDTLGHHVGDELLGHIARRLEAPLGEGEMIARLGGDEFAVLLPGANLDKARQTASHLASTLTRPFDMRGLILKVETSIGIALFPDHGQQASTLIQRADVAMYVAKRTKSQICVYNPDHDMNSVRDLTLKGELHHAVEEDQLVLFYQPKIDAESGRIEGVEGLLRWRHPNQGLVQPDDFIRIAESTGLIRPMTRWALGEGIRQCARWRGEGLPLTVAINLSARNLLEEDLPEIVADLLRDHKLDPSDLTLEITESGIVEDPERAFKIISALSNTGVKISIDDFGTGYSSLGYLKNFPASELKIDKTFVMGMTRSQGDSVIVRSTIELAHNLGMRATAEGVDSEDHWQLLRSLGVDTGQGFHFSRPIPANELNEWARASNWAVVRREAPAESEAVLVP